MGIRVSFNGRQARNPFVRVISALFALLVLTLVVVIGAAVLLPLLGIMLALGLLAAVVLILRATFRRGGDGGANRPPTIPSPAPADADPEVVEDDRVARAKPVERL